MGLATTLALAVALALMSGCSSPGRYGYARKYVPTADEESAAGAARDFDAPMAALKPELWKGKKVRFFMVVEDRKAGPSGMTYITGRIHVLNEINGCDDKNDERSCRVTIKPSGHEKVHVLSRVAAEDDIGTGRIGGGSLLRVVGNLADATDPDDGKFVVQVAFYRHWPAGYFVREGELKQ